MRFSRISILSCIQVEVIVSSGAFCPSLSSHLCDGIPSAQRSGYTSSRLSGASRPDPHPHTPFWSTVLLGSQKGEHHRLFPLILSSHLFSTHTLPSCRDCNRLVSSACARNICSSAPSTRLNGRLLIGRLISTDRCFLVVVIEVTASHAAFTVRTPSITTLTLSAFSARFSGPPHSMARVSEALRISI